MSITEVFPYFSAFAFFVWQFYLRRGGCVYTEDSEDDGYMRDPSWLKDIETAAAIAKLYDTTQVSNAYDDTGMSNSRVSMID